MPRLTKAVFASAKRELGLKGKLTRKQVQRVFKRAMKKLGRTERRVSKKGKVYYTKPKRRVKRRMARRRGRRRYTMTIPIAPIAGLLAGMHEPIVRIMQGKADLAIEAVSRNYTGYSPKDKNWLPERMARGLLPLVIGCLVHKFVGGPPLNLNRVLARAKVPFIRI